MITLPNQVATFYELFTKSVDLSKFHLQPVKFFYKGVYFIVEGNSFLHMTPSELNTIIEDNQGKEVKL